MGLINLENKIKKRKATICIMGLGYVGLPLVVEFCNKNFNVLGFDVSKDKINLIKRTQKDISEVSIKTIKKHFKTKKLTISSSPEIVSKADCVIICVPTPLNKSFEPEMSHIKSCVDIIEEYAKKESVIILESTSFPGTTREIIYDRLNKNKSTQFKYVAYSPERVDPGNKKFNIKNTPKVIGGINKKSLKLTDMLYSHICYKTVLVKSCEEAEMVKLLENIYRQTNIALINEMMMISNRLDIDIWNVIKACSTKPFGYTQFFPGPGTGGHCIPLDPMYLSWKAKSKNYFSRFIDLSTDINQNMPNYVVNKISKILNNLEKSIKGSKCFIIGVSYKKNVSDVREAPSLKIIESLIRKGAKVDYFDPYVPSIIVEGSSNLVLKSKPTNKKMINESDIVIIVADHDNIKWNSIIKNAKIILDTKGVLHNSKKELHNVLFL